MKLIYIISVLPLLLHYNMNLTVKSSRTTKTMRVMSFNIRRLGPEQKQVHKWANRLPDVQDIIEKINPHVFGLQEATKQQISDIKKNIAHQYAWVGKPRGSSWFGLGKNEANPIFYNKQNLQLLECGTFKINKKMTWFLPWNIKKTGYLPRICTWALFKTKTTNKKFYIFNTHLCNKFESARKHGLRYILKQIKKIRKHSTAPIFLIGDFNTSLSKSIKKTTKNFYDTKQLATKKIGPHYSAIGWKSNLKKMIDHILCNNSDICINQHTIYDTKNYSASDHRPVYIDISLGKN